MADEMMATLEAIDPALLTEVVREDQRSPEFDITQWSVKRLSDKGIINPDGLWLFSGQGQDSAGSRAWAVVLKILQRPEQEPPLSDLWHWKRELFLAQSKMLQRLPGPVRAARVYRAEEKSDGAWLWQEYIDARRPNGPWELEDYGFAARQLGIWHARCLASGPMPAEPWLTRQHYRSWYADANPDKDLQFVLNQKYVVGEIRQRYERLWADRAILYDVLERLPQVFSHFDSQRRNLFIRQDANGQDELVLVDWAICGLGPLGAELYSLVGMSAVLLEWPPSAVAQLDEMAFGQYMQGLQQEGWSGETEVIRLGYAAWVAVWFGAIFPNSVASWCTPQDRAFSLQQFGVAEEDLFLKWWPLVPYSLDCADEARRLIKYLRLA